MASRKTATTEAKPVHMDDVLVEIGGKNTVPEFTENLRGAKPGEERDLRSELSRRFRRQAPRRQDFRLHRED